MAGAILSFGSKTQKFLRTGARKQAVRRNVLVRQSCLEALALVPHQDRQRGRP